LSANCPNEEGRPTEAAYSFDFIISSSQAAGPLLCISFSDRRAFSALMVSKASAVCLLVGDGAGGRGFSMVDFEKLGPLFGCLLMVPIKWGYCWFLKGATALF
jgi:hypothetical protein